MAKKKTDTSFRRQAEKTLSEIDRLQKKGYEFVGITSIPITTDIPTPNMDSEKTESFLSPDVGGPMVRSSGQLFFSTETSAEAINGGTPKKGFIRWGPQNNLPAQIYRAAGALPYTATALRYLIDLTVGLGPKLMYVYPVVSGNRVTEEMCPYELAGDLLRSRILAIREKIAASDTSPVSTVLPSQPPAIDDEDGNVKVSYRRKPSSPEPPFEPSDPDSVGTLEDELSRLLTDYQEWERTTLEVKDFEGRNNLEEHYLKCCTDDTHLDIYFPTIGLSQGTDKDFEPKIKEVGFIPATCCRFEEKDDNLNIRYVYYSEQWRMLDGTTGKSSDSVAYPVLPSHGRVHALRSKVEENKRKSLKERQLWYCCPSVYPSGMRGYYPTPAWWSIFSSFVYQYAFTLVSDKYIAQKNSTMWGKLIYLNAFYLEKLYDQLGDTTNEQKKQRRDAIVDSINNFLRSRENNGKTCALDSFVGPDGKAIMHSIELVDVPTPQKATMTKEEMEQISSIIFFALGVHPGLVGAVPGKTTSGGTFQRELSLLKMQQVSGRQRAYLQFLNDIARFNRWDVHARYVIKQQVLTTLDRNANGLEDTISD